MCFRKFFNSRLLRIIVLSFGLLCITIAFSGSLFWNEVSRHVVTNELILSNSSNSYRMWIKTPVPLFIDFYFFNWTNPADLKQPGYKPKFEEAGPYRFREEVSKTDLIWNQNKTVTYKKVRRWYFQSLESNGSLDDVIISVNVIALTAARSTRYWNRLARIPLSMMLSTTQSLVASKRVGELLFDGFTDPLIDFASKIPGLSSQIPFDRFGWFYKRNDSSEFDGVFNVETGANGIESLGKLKFWNFKNHTTFFKGPCGDVRGSAGDFWPPKKQNKISLFSPDMCRYIDFNYGTEESVGGIKGYRYDSGPGLFDNGTADPENKCFCEGNCHPSGVVNVSSCRFGAPAFVSYPHFFTADPSYLNLIEGLKPEFQKHDSYIILEQEWGIPLEIAIRLQINILIESDPGIRLLDGIPTIFFPMLWFEQKVTVPEHMRREIQNLLQLPTIGLIASIVFYVTGFSSLILYVVCSCLGRRERQ